ncbi:MAG: hypothetical protein GY921_10000, partial [Phycisphaeraceae bacterium]|nr:hypothetical protein [Phycisphaeraceae bacterium]
MPSSVARSRVSLARAFRDGVRAVLLVLMTASGAGRVIAQPAPPVEPSAPETYQSIGDRRLASTIESVWTATMDPEKERDRPTASDLVERRGLLVQVTPVPGEDGTPLAEWVVEQGDGTILVVATRRASVAPRLRTMVRLRGRFAGEIETRARDGRVRRWPLFVG